MSRGLAAFPVMACVFVLGACQTEYRDDRQRPATGDDPRVEALDRRRVLYRVEPAFYRDPPDCVVVLGAPGGKAGEVANIRIDTVVARHLRDKVPRVIGPLGRDRAQRRLALDLDDAGDRRRFADLERCDAFVRWRLIGSSSGYFLVWSRRAIGLDVEMFRDPDRRLWRASHVAHRSDGSLPLSPLSAPIAIFEASRFSNDRDIVPSMIDDIMRRLVVTLPDVR